MYVITRNFFVEIWKSTHHKTTIEAKNINVWLLFLKVHFTYGSFSTVRRYSANEKSICIETTTVHV